MASPLPPASQPPPDAPVLELARVRKTFGSVTVLDVEGLRFEAGKVYGLLGANGSGKSTLVKILSGYYVPDAGSAGRLRGRDIAWPLRVGGSGISVVQQEYALADSLSVVENLLAVRARGRSLFGGIRWQRERARARDSLRFVGLDVDPSTPVASLSTAERALVAIARTVEEFQGDDGQHRILILDEPTANLGHDDVERVLHVIRRFAGEGGVVILVNHSLPEVRSVADEVVVLRDGVASLTGPLGGLSTDTLLAAMFDSQVAERRSPAEVSAAPAESAAAPLVELAWPSGHPLNPDRRIAVRPGEIVGFTGLVGMGQDDLPYQVYGSQDRAGLEVLCRGVALRPGPRRARRAGLVLVPGERVRDGLWLGGTVAENILVANLGQLTTRGLLTSRRMRAAAREMCDTWGIVSGGPDGLMGSLSGGNQQRLALARAVASEPWDVLIVHEPTQGIDVAARRIILNLLAELAGSGKAVLVFSADYECLSEVCSRVFVVSGAAIGRELVGPDITEESLVEASMTAGRTVGAGA
jgi:ribose transport system ATP-binding protein